jgi:peptide/nickel transport system ATP-binding protein
MSEEKFLSVKDLVVEYTQGKNIIHAVNGVSFDLERGKSLGLVGETGAGKTSIAKAILRILPDVGAYIRGGKIELEDANLLDLSEAEMRGIRGDKIAMIFQDPMTALNPLMTVGEQITEAIELHHAEWDSKTCMEESVKMLEMVGIPGERYSEYPHQFSGGMKQRVVIAMALSCNPQLLLADEPTTALDVTIQAQVLRLIKELRERLNTSMILITHDLGVVAEMCDEVATVYAGRIVEKGTIMDVYLHPSHPYTKGLFEALPSMNSDSERLKPIPGMLPDPARLPEGCAFAPRCKYATEQCRKQIPSLRETEPGHFVACHLDIREVKTDE